MNGLCLSPAQGPHPSAGKVAAKREDLSRIAPAFLASGIQGVGRLFLPEPEIIPNPQTPVLRLHPHPHPQRQFQSTPSSSPWRSAGEITKAILVLSHSQNQRALRYIPLPPSQSSGGQRVPLETTSWCLSQRAPAAPVCGGRGLCVSAQVSEPGRRWSRYLCVVCMCVHVLVCSSAHRGARLRVRGSPCLSAFPSVHFSGLEHLGECAPVCVSVHICHRAWAPSRINPPPGSISSWAGRDRSLRLPARADGPAGLLTFGHESSFVSVSSGKMLKGAGLQG